MRRPPVLLAVLLALSVFVPFAVVLHAAVSHSETITGNNSGGTMSDTSASLTGSAGDLWIASICYFDTPTVSSIQLDGSTGFTSLVNQTCCGGVRLYVYYLPNTSSGAHTVTFNYSASTTFKRWFVTRAAGVATSSPVDGSGAYATGTSMAADSGAATTVGTSFIYGLICSGPSGGFTAGSGWTEGAQGTSSNDAISEWKANPGTTTHNATATLAMSAGWGASAQAFLVAGAAGGCRGALSLRGVGGC